MSDKSNEILQALLDDVSSLKEQQAENEKLLTDALSKLEKLTGNNHNGISNLDYAKNAEKHSKCLGCCHC